jgi:hypothetical protein
MRIAIWTPLVRGWGLALVYRHDDFIRYRGLALVHAIPGPDQEPGSVPSGRLELRGLIPPRRGGR